MHPFNGAFTRFDGYRNVWPTDGYTTTSDIYLDIDWAVGSGFDYSVASSGSDGNHQRDFIFHIAKDTSTNALLVGADNNSNFGTREDLETLQNFSTIVNSGWYTFQHDFFDLNGSLAVTLSLFDSNGSSLFSETRNSASDLIATEIGGNRYGWITFVNLDSGLAIDNTKLDINQPVPEPATILLFGTGLIGLAGVARRKKK